MTLRGGYMSDAQFAFAIVAAVLAFHLLIIGVPLAYSFFLSLHETNVILRSQEYVGFDLWQQALEDENVIDATWRSLWFAAMVTVLSFVLSLAIALVLDMEFPMRRLLRALVLMPWAISEIVTAGLWTMMIDPGWGVFNGILVPLGIVDEGFVWLNQDLGAVLGRRRLRLAHRTTGRFLLPGSAAEHSESALRGGPHRRRGPHRTLPVRDLAAHPVRGADRSGGDDR